MSLERDLRSLRVDWPETPALRPELAPRRSRRPLVLALAALVVAVAVALAVPPARSAILRLFHLGGVTVDRVETLPDAAARSLEAGLGPSRPLDEAARIAGFAPVLPPGVDARRAYALEGVIAVPLGGNRLLTEIEGGSAFALSKKYVGPGTHVEGVELNGEFALWLEGGPHVLVFLESGRPVTRTLRLAGNTLVWQHGTRTFRLEGPLSKREALAVARSLRFGSA